MDNREKRMREVLASVLDEERHKKSDAQLIRDGNEHAAELDGDDVIRAMIAIEDAAYERAAEVARADKRGEIFGPGYRIAVAIEALKGQL